MKVDVEEWLPNWENEGANAILVRNCCLIAEFKGHTTRVPERVGVTSGWPGFVEKPR